MEHPVRHHTCEHLEARWSSFVLAHTSGGGGDFDQLARGHAGPGGSTRCTRCVDYLAAVIAEAFALGPDSLDYVEISGAAGDGFRYGRRGVQ